MSERSIQANQANARKSTGPRTAAGKLAIARNGLKHGILSQTLLLDDESPRDFGALLADLEAALRPVGVLEAVLIGKGGRRPLASTATGQGGNSPYSNRIGGRVQWLLRLEQIGRDALGPLFLHRRTSNLQTRNPGPVPGGLGWGGRVGRSSPERLAGVGDSGSASLAGTAEGREQQRSEFHGVPGKGVRRQPGGLPVVSGGLVPGAN